MPSSWNEKVWEKNSTAPGASQRSGTAAATALVSAPPASQPIDSQRRRGRSAARAGGRRCWERWMDDHVDCCLAGWLGRQASVEQEGAGRVGGMNAHGTPSHSTQRL